jgi:hypothetical protein
MIPLKTAKNPQKAQKVLWLWILREFSAVHWQWEIKANQTKSNLLENAELVS